MKVKALTNDGNNTGKLKYQIGIIPNNAKDSKPPTRPEFDIIEIKKGRYIQAGISHPLVTDKQVYFERVYCFEHEEKNIYRLYPFGKIDSLNGFYVALNGMEKQRFLWLQGKHWLQKEENIRYIVNIVFLIIGTCIAIHNMK